MDDAMQMAIMLVLAVAAVIMAITYRAARVFVISSRTLLKVYAVIGATAIVACILVAVWMYNIEQDVRRHKQELEKQSQKVSEHE